jgi:hypothetical protein
MTRDQEKAAFLDRAETLVSELERHLHEIEKMTTERREADNDHG